MITTVGELQELLHSYSKDTELLISADIGGEIQIAAYHSKEGVWEVVS